MLAEIKMNNAGDSLWTIVQETDFQIVLRTCSKVREAGAGESQPEPKGRQSKRAILALFSVLI